MHVSSDECKQFFLGCGSIGFAIDSTGSSVNGVPEDRSKAALGLVDGLKSKGIDISSWTLTTFNDESGGWEDIDPVNVQLIVTTDNTETFQQGLENVTFGGGTDPTERVTQGNF